MGQLDIAFKDFAKTSLTPLMAWLRPELKLISVIEMPQELPASLRRVDVLAKAISAGDLAVLQILECQAQQDADLAATILVRAALAHFYYRMDVSTTLLVLRPEALIPEEYAYGQHRGQRLVHRIEVRRLYEEPAEEALASGVDALVPVMRPVDGDRGRMLREVIARIAESEVSQERKKLMIGWAATFATLNLSKVLVDVIVREASRRKNFMLNALQDLPLLRDTYQEGIDKGIEKGIEKGVDKERRRGLVRIYERRHGAMPQALDEALVKIKDPEALDALLGLFLEGGADEIAQKLLASHS